MAHLSLRLLGAFQVELGAEPVTGFESDKARALLAYLVAEPDRPHRRESLAGLLWPDYAESSARTNLRSALANLRQVIGDRESNPPWLHISRHTLQFNTASDAWADVWAFTELAASPAPPQEAIPQWEQALAVYRGSFLEGFSLADSPLFEEWALLRRERFHRLAADGLRLIAAYHAKRGAYRVALGYAQRLLELDPLLESAHRQVMRLLVSLSERGAALAQYEACRSALETELDVPPSRETELLVRQIRQGKGATAVQRLTTVREPSTQRPPFLEEGLPEEGAMPLFVARDQELAWLEGRLAGALAGQAGVAFVIGGPGRGKTALLGAFARRATQAQPDLLVAGGNGNAYSGVGDPYLPFRSALEMLCGEVEAQWAAGAIDRGQALRLWGAVPAAAEALAEFGPDLIDTFISGRALVARLAAHPAMAATRPGWRVRLERLVARKASLPPDPNLQQSALFRQYTRVLAALARGHPLVLLLDDLQWIDAGSAGLLFHLGHELAGGRVLIVGAYRPEEVTRAQGERHPLEGVLGEFRRRYGDIWLDLARVGQTEGRRLVAALLDSEPNRLGKRFRDDLFQRTEGHPLFTTELLRALQARGDLVREGGPDGPWVEDSPLDWGALPPKVEGVIAERINRLDPASRELLAVASVEGETFTAQVVAQVQGRRERDVIRQLSSVLEREQRLVRAQGLRRLGGSSLSLHRFQHNLFQKYLYDTLNEAERAYLHRDVGTALEALYAGHPDELATAAPLLARHFLAAGDTEKAVQYLGQAGQRATRMSAHDEAAAHFSRALELLHALPDTAERAKTELSLQLSLAVSLVTTKGWGASEMASVVARAQTLCGPLGDTPQRFGTLWFTHTYRMMRGDHLRAFELLEQCCALAERSEDEGLIVVAYYGMASLSFFLGDFTAAVAYGKRVRDLYDPGRHHVMTYIVVGHDPAAQAFEAAGQSLWLLGYPDQARQWVREAVALAEALAHPPTACSAYGIEGVVASWCRDWPTARERAERALALSQEHDLPVTEAFARSARGLALARQKQVEQGMAQVQQGLIAWEATEMLGYGSQFRAWLAEACLIGGQAQAGIETVDETLDFVARSRECRWEAELHRLKGELLLIEAGDEVEAEAERAYRLAIEVARRQQAKSWELRATMSLARLWGRQGRRAEARDTLAEIYGWFTEGFDTGDLVEAAALLDELSGT